MLLGKNRPQPLLGDPSSRQKKLDTDKVVFILIPKLGLVSTLNLLPGESVEVLAGALTLQLRPGSPGSGGQKEESGVTSGQGRWHVSTWGHTY